MGGAKKKSLSQAEKQQQLQTKKQEKQEPKKTAKTKLPEKKVGGIEIPRIENKKLVSELSEMKAVTPYTIASKYNIRQSVAKNLIRELESQGVISPVSGNSRLRIYKVTVS